MKKNLLSILILTLLIVNIVMTSIMMLGMTGTIKKTSALVSKVAGVLDIELASDNMEEGVPIGETASHTIEGTMSIQLKDNGDGKDHYMICQVTLYMDTKNKDYKKYGETMADTENMVKSEIVDVVSSHTIEEVRADTEGLKSEILVRLQKMYNSEFIYKVAFSDVKAQ